MGAWLQLYEGSKHWCSAHSRGQEMMILHFVNSGENFLCSHCKNKTFEEIDMLTLSCILYSVSIETSYARSKYGQILCVNIESF